MSKTTAGKPEYSYAICQYLRGKLAVSPFFAEDFPVGDDMRPWTICYPNIVAGLFRPNWHEIVTLEDVPYIGISGGLGGQLDNKPYGFCDVGLTIISSDYIDTRTSDNDFEFNMSAALGAIERLYIDHTSTGVPIDQFMDVEHDIRAAIATDFQFNRQARTVGEAHFIRLDVLIRFEVTLYNPYMP